LADLLEHGSTAAMDRLVSYPFQRFQRMEESIPYVMFWKTILFSLASVKLPAFPQCQVSSNSGPRTGKA
jgi:hypothetical protein